MKEEQEIKKQVKKRYSKIAQNGQSCCASTCCTPSATDIAQKIGYSKKDLKSIPQTSNMGLGCGNPVALAGLKKGEVVLDLGSGGGLDAFLAAKKVGIHGKVIGVDMTEAMIKKATSTSVQHGYKNVEFRLGEIEDLPVDDNSVDVIISNCVINLAPDKEKVFQEAYRVLRTGGRLCVSDLVTEGALPDNIRKSIDAWASCIAGALDKTQYLTTISAAGFKNVKIISESIYDLDALQGLTGKITSVQVEAHKEN